jgi:hypothetical protein
MLKAEYARTLDRVKAMLASRPSTHVLVIQHRDAIANAIATAERVSRFLAARLDVGKMAAAIDPALYRNRAR